MTFVFIDSLGNKSVLAPRGNSGRGRKSRNVTYVLLPGAQLDDQDCGSRAAVRVRTWGRQTTWTMADGSTVTRAPWSWSSAGSNVPHAAYGPTDVIGAQLARDTVQQLLDRVDVCLEGKGWPPAVWSASPGTWASWLWLRTLAARGVKQLPEPVTGAVRDAWRTGQGRIEWFPEPAEMQYPAFMEVWDARAAYTSVMAEIPLVQSWRIQTGDHVPDGKRRPIGRYLVEFESDFGVIPVWDGKRWTWPKQGTGWADPWELHLLDSGIVDGTYRVRSCVVPDSQICADALGAIRRLLDPQAAGLIGRMCRTALVHLVGKLGQQHVGSVEERMPIDAIPADWQPGLSSHVEGDELVTVRPRPITAAQAATMQLPIASTVWGRARARLVSSPGPDRSHTGAAWLPAGAHIAAMRTDALWIVGTRPDWSDDGKVGRLRLIDQVQIDKWPRTITDRAGHGKTA